MMNNFERSHHNAPETSDRDGDQVYETVKSIDAAAESAITEGQALLERINSESGLSADAVAHAESVSHIREQLQANEVAIQTLRQKTLASIQSLVDLLADGVPSDLANQMMLDHGVDPHVIGSGAFYDVFEIPGTAEVMKQLKLNFLFDQAQAVRMLARHAHEADRLRDFFTDQFVPDAVFICPEKMRDVFEAEKDRIGAGGVKLYDLATFTKIQLDRRLQTNYARRDVPEDRQGIDKAFGLLGRALASNDMFRTECAGVMVERKITGVTLQELMARGPRGGQSENWDALRSNMAGFLSRLMHFSEAYALLWHRLDSDNVVVETDENGELTGGTKIIDLNFTEKSFEGLRELANQRLRSKIIEPLAAYFDITSDEISTQI